MPKVESLRIRRIESMVRYVRDIERSRKFFTEALDFSEIGVSSEALNKEARQRSIAVKANDVLLVIATPDGEGGRAARWLRKHPDGIGTLVFEVEDIAHAFRTLEGRGGTPITDVQTFQDDGGTLKMFNITTPFGDTTFRFVQRDGYRALFPGFVAHELPKGGNNVFGFERIDHVTSNFQTMAPALLWMEHVMGFERFWDISFHTTDVAREAQSGSGLKSIVMHDPHSGVKFANNEPLRPFFKASQINLFGEDHRGDGVQHAALTVPDIVSTVRALRQRGVEFMPTPGTYYDVLPQRLKDIHVGEIDEDIDELRELGILVDGGAPHSYLLQIFLQDAATLYRDPQAGPFFLEIIQRKGDQGFGGGNFRALFESIERSQRQEGRI